MPPALHGLRLVTWCMLIVCIVDAHSYAHSYAHSTSHSLHYTNPFAARSPPQPSPSRYYTASSDACRVTVYPRGFVMSMPANRPDVDMVRFEGTCRFNGRVGKFSHVVRQPIDGQWTYANNAVQLSPGDIINYRVLAGNRMRRGGFVWDEQAFTVDDIELEPNPYYPEDQHTPYNPSPEPSYTSPSVLTPLLNKFKDVLLKAATPPNSYLPPSSPTPPPRSPHPDDDAEMMTNPHPTPPPPEPEQPEPQPESQPEPQPETPDTQPEIPEQLQKKPSKTSELAENQPELPLQLPPKTPYQPQPKQQTPPPLPPTPPQMPPTTPKPQVKPTPPAGQASPPPTFLPPPPVPDFPPPPSTSSESHPADEIQPPSDPQAPNQQSTTPSTNPSKQPTPPTLESQPTPPTSNNNPSETPVCSTAPPSSDQCACATPPTSSSTCPPASMEAQCSALSDQLTDILRHVQFIEQRTGQLLDKVDTLEEMQAGMLTEQANRSRHLLLTAPPVDPTHALRDVRTLVTDRLELPALRNAVVKARPIETGVLLECRSVADKLRILYRAQKRVDEAHVVLLDYQPSDADKDLLEEMASLERAYAGFDENTSFGRNSSEWSSSSVDVRIDSDADDSKPDAVGGDDGEKDAAVDKPVTEPKPQRRLAWN